ncbi:hypothetical protein JCM8208_007336 [Rhodotorula glutinis]
MDNQILISSVEPDKPSPLLRLPDELLAIIFSHVYVAKLSPICRRVYPFQQKQLYQHGVRIRSYKALASLCAAVQGSSFIGGLIIDLYINLYGSAVGSARRRSSGAGTGTSNGARPAETQSGRGREVNDSQGLEIVQPRAFYNLILRLSRLGSLDMICIEPDLLNVVLFNSEGVLVFPHLYRMSFTTSEIRPPAYGNDSGNWVRNLARLPQLSTLCVRHSAERSLLPPMQPPRPIFKTLTRLCLHGAHLGGSDAPALVDLAPHLVELRLEDTMSAPACASILHTAPTGLRVLYLLSPLSRDVDPRPGCNLDEVLPRFKHIEDLYLSVHSFSPACLAPYLASLPALRTLHFGWASQATDDLLHALFVDHKSPYRLRHLRSLELNHVWDLRGRTLEENGWNFPAGATSGLDGLDDGWYPGRWPPGCSAEGTEAAIAAARAIGIKVDGTSVSAASWEEAYESERNTRLLVWGLRTGDYAEARDELGVLTVEIFKARVLLERGELFI